MPRLKGKHPYHCPRCDRDLTADDFYMRANRPGQRTAYCKQCSHAQVRDWRAKNPDYKLDGTRRVRALPSEEQRLYRNAAVLKLQRARRQMALVAYGGDPPTCACCGEHHLEFLTIDHVNGGGNQHRGEIKRALYRWLYRNDYPAGFQVLCWNCNCAKGMYGSCPHQR